MDNSINISEYKNKQREITDNDLFSIFMGLVKLIKRKVANDFEESRQIELGKYREKIEILKTELESRDRTINQLIEKNSILKGKKIQESHLAHMNRVKTMVAKLSKFKVGNKEAIN